MGRFDSPLSRRHARSPPSRWSSKSSVSKKGRFDTGMEFTAPNWGTTELMKFQKSFYQEQIVSSSRSESEISAFRLLHKISLSGSNIPRPVFTFKELNLPDSILKVIIKNGWQNPTPIQSQGLPMALCGRDMVGIAQTGSGKTATFLIPALVHIAAQPRLLRNEGPICLVLVPTRELAQQVLAVAKEFTGSANLRTMCFYGGSSKGPQVRELRNGAEICIATPGRLIDFIREQKDLLSRVTYLVLDEADRMLDMGFEPQIRKIIGHIRPDRQTLMWSATWPRDVQTLAREFLTDYIQVNIGSVSLHANPNIRQIIEIIDEWNKEERLVQLLMSFGRSRCLVFVETKRRTDQITYSLKRKGFLVGAMHGDKQQRDREITLSNFKDGRINVLVATDVASRGLDIDGIEFVINVDFPNQTEDYIHRIGRTARSDKTGTAITFFTTKNMRQARDLIDILQEAHQEINPELYELAGLSNYNKKSGFAKKNQTAFQRKPPGRFSKGPMSSGFSAAASSFQHQDSRVPNSISTFQNGTSSLTKSNSAFGNVQTLLNTSFPTTLKSGGSSDPPITVSRESLVGSLSQVHPPGFTGLAVPSNLKEDRSGETNFTKPNVGGFVNAPVSVPVSDSSRFDRRNLNTESKGPSSLHSGSAAQSKKPFNSSEQKWSVNNWVDSANQSQTYWNPSPTVSFPSPNPTFGQRLTSQTQKLPTLMEQPPTTSTSTLTSGLRSRGSTNSLSTNVPPTVVPTFAQPWPGYAPSPYSVNPPPPVAPVTPGWCSTWGPNYGGY